MAMYSQGSSGGSTVNQTTRLLQEALEQDRSFVSESRFVEWFSGSVLDQVWDQTNLPPFNAPTFSMIDDINEGFSIFVPAINPSKGSITAGKSQRQYDPLGCEMESVQRNVFVNGRSATGFGNRLDGDLGNTPDESVFVANDSTQTFYNLNNVNGVSQTLVNSSIPVDQIFHRTKLELEPTTSRLFIDTILEATNTTTLPDPNTKLYAGTKIATFAVLTAEVRIRFMEVLNT